MAIVLKVLVGVVGILFCVLGLRWMFTPQAMAAENGLSLLDAVGLNTARGDLGGLFLAGAILCALGLRTGDGRWLQAIAIVVALVACGRVVGIAVDGFAGPSGMALTVEVAMIAILLAASRSGSSTTPTDT